jgi:hypothetical protein
MANRDQLVAAIDKFIQDYGSLPSGGVPFISTIIQGASYTDVIGVNISLPADMKFTTSDLTYASSYLATKYPMHYTEDEWYNGLTQYLNERLADGVIPEPEPEPIKASIFSKPLLIFGGALLLIYAFSRK